MLFRSGTKDDAGEGIGLDALVKVREAVPDIPLVAIGGINLGNIRDIIRTGADSVAVISAVVAKEDIKKAVMELGDVILKTRPHIGEGD